MKSHRLALLLNITSMYTLFCAQAYATPVDNQALVTLPRVQVWESRGRGLLELSDEETIFYSTPSLEPLAAQFADELLFLTGKRPETRLDTPEVRSIEGFHLQLTSNLPSEVKKESLRREAYELVIDKGVHISAHDVVGAFYGTRTLLQQLGSRGNALPRGRVIDYPKVGERGVMLDLANQYLSMEMIEGVLREMSALKYNALHLRFANDSDFRLESRVARGITSKEFYSFEDITKLNQLARQYHVTIIPEVPLVTHVGVVSKFDPGYVINHTLSDKENVSVLNIAGESSLAFAKDLALECASQFHSPYFHIGARDIPSEESLCETLPFVVAAIKSGNVYANPEDPLHPYVCPSNLIIAYLNDLNQELRKNGKTMRMWSDWSRDSLGNHPINKLTLPDVTIVQEVMDGIDPSELISDGYTLVNSSLEVSVKDRLLNLDKEADYFSWDPSNLITDSQVSHNKLSGGQMVVSMDDLQGHDENVLLSALKRPLSVVGNSLWHGSAETMTMEQLLQNYHEIDTALGKHGEVTSSDVKRLYGYDDEPCFEAGLAKTVSLKLGSLPTPWTLAFWMNPQEVTAGGELLSSKMGRIIFGNEEDQPVFGYALAKEVLGLEEDEVSYFSTPLSDGEWTHLTLVGTESGVKLYINGEFSEEIKGLLPLPGETLGSNINPASVKLRDMRIFSKAITEGELESVMHNRWINEQTKTRIEVIAECDLDSFSEELKEQSEIDGLVDLDESEMEDLADFNQSEIDGLVDLDESEMEDLVVFD